MNATGAASALFRLTLSESPDALLRVLNLFLVQGAQLDAVEMRRTGGETHLRLVARGLAGARLQRLAAHLSSARFVTTLEPPPA